VTVGCIASEGDSVRGSPCGEPARLRFTSLCPPFFLLRGYPRERISYGSGAPPSCGDSAGPSRCVPLKSYVAGYPGERISYGSGVRLPCSLPDMLPYE